jgi:hypothetical protein
VKSFRSSDLRSCSISGAGRRPWRPVRQRATLRMGREGRNPTGAATSRAPAGPDSSADQEGGVARASRFSANLGRCMQLQRRLPSAHHIQNRTATQAIDASGAAAFCPAGSFLSVRIMNYCNQTTKPPWLARAASIIVGEGKGCTPLFLSRTQQLGRNFHDARLIEDHPRTPPLLRVRDCLDPCTEPQIRRSGSAAHVHQAPHISQM